MYHLAIIIAYYLDPRYHGRLLLITEEYSFTMIANKISQFIDQDLSGQLAKELLWYNSKTELFSLSIFWELEVIKDPIN